MTPVTILDYFLKWEKETPDVVFLRQPQGENWKEYTWSQAGTKSRKVLGALQKLGLKKGDRVALLSSNCAEWIICDLAIMMGGYISVPLYANVNVTTMQEILTHSGARLIFIGKLLPKDWDSQRNAIPSDIISVTMEGFEKESITPWNNFLNGDAPEVEPTKPSLDEIITIIYTSGTTGTPKGVVHTYRSIINALNVAADEGMLNVKGNRFLSYLPLSHAAERGLVEFGTLYSGGSISFVESQERFATTLRQVKPTHFFGVPRIWEKFQSKILESLPQKKMNIFLKIPGLAHYIKSKIKKSLGLEKAIVVITGAAPITPALMMWFQKLGITIREAYGMSENFNVCCINPKSGIKIGYAGKLFDKQEIIIDPETHEIIQRCGWTMQGYYRDEKQTALTLRNGFLHTGDMGELTPDKFLKITGRVKDIFKTSKGEYVDPGKIETKFLDLVEVDQACVMGTKYPQAFAIVVLSEAGKKMDRAFIAEKLKSTWQAYNQNCMDYQRIKKVIIVKEEWTPDNGLLTPTLKMKRNALSAKYETTLEPFYNLDEPVSWE